MVTNPHIKKKFEEMTDKLNALAEECKTLEIRVYELEGAMIQLEKANSSQEEVKVEEKAVATKVEDEKSQSTVVVDKDSVTAKVKAKKE